MQTKPNIEIVVSRFAENIDFLKEPPFSSYPIICYNKGTEIIKPDEQNIKIKTLDNVGREGHTYLRHIIKNYDKLADIIIFTTGSCMLNSSRKEKIHKIIELVEHTHNTVFIGHPYYDVYKNLYNFTLDHHTTSNPENRKLNSDLELVPAKIRPYGKWYNSVFGDLKVTLVPYNGIFAVSRKHILQHPKTYYKKLLKFLKYDMNPEYIHYFERAWVSVFSPIPETCLYYENHFAKEN